jgi:hypothetical protein
MGAYDAHCSGFTSCTTRAVVGRMASLPWSSSKTPIVALTMESPRAMRWVASWLRAKIGSSPGRSPLMGNGFTARL